MKATLLFLAAIVLVGCERRPEEFPNPNVSSAPPLTNAVTPAPTNSDSTVINRPVENPPLTNRAATNAPPPPPPP